MNSKLIAGVVGALFVALAGAGLGAALLAEPEQEAPAGHVPAVRGAAPLRAKVVTPDTPTSAATTLAPGRIEREPGQQITSAVSFWGRLVQGEETLLELRGAGRLESTCYAASDDELVLGQRVILERFSGAGLAQEELNAIRSELQEGREALVRIDRRGKLLGIKIEGVFSRQARNFLRSWLSSQQVQLAGTPSERWTAEGQDTAGASADTYRVTGAEGEAVAIRRSRTFLPGQAQNPLAEGGLNALLRQDGVTLRIRAKETVGIGGGETKAAPIRYSREQELDYVSERTVAIQPLGEVQWEEGLELESQLAAQPEERTTHQLLELLTQDSRQAFFGLRRRLLEVPSEIELLLAAATNPAYPLAARRSMIDVLGEVHSPEAQRALLAIAKHETLEEELVPNVFLSLGQAPSPLPEVVGYFGEQITGSEGERQGWAIQGAGLLASLTTDAQAQTSLVDALEGSLSAGRRQDLALSALGNAGVERSFELIGTFLAADEPTLRAEAVFALRNQPSEEASESIRVALEEDPDALVRKEALRALSHRAPHSHAPLAAKALQDEDVAVRLEAIKTLGSWLESSGEAGELDAEVEAQLHQILRSASESDEPSVREAASQLIAG